MSLCCSQVSRRLATIVEKPDKRFGGVVLFIRERQVITEFGRPAKKRCLKADILERPWIRHRPKTRLVTDK
jgi:hypothetical protein